MSGWNKADMGKATGQRNNEKSSHLPYTSDLHPAPEVGSNPRRRRPSWIVVLALMCLLGSLIRYWDNLPLSFVTKHSAGLLDIDGSCGDSIENGDILSSEAPASSVASDADVRVPIRFNLKHIFHHNTERNPKNHARLDVTEHIMEKYSLLNAYGHVGDETVDDRGDTVVGWDTQYSISATPKKIRRMRRRDPDFVESYLEFARLNPKSVKSMEFDWVDETVLAPNITDRDTIIQLAFMSANAYVDVPFTGDWTNVSEPWDGDAGFGWMSDGVRGHVFVDEAETIVIISVKGTSAAVFDSGGDTAPNDKVNDNLLFSCCCARISYLWNTVCDCYTGDSYTCDQECLEEQLYSEDRYYRAVLDVYRNVTELYPDIPNIWVTGHSLGGSLSSMLGRTYGLPVVAIEAPGELLATKRLHLPMPPGVPLGEDYIYHFGHTADPVYMGVCNGAGSSCWIAGYAMETQCHSGLQCVYDVVDDLGWHVSMVNHRIHVVIDDVILQYNETAKCEVPEPCADCFNWKFVVPDPSSTSTSTNKPTSTSEAKTKTTKEKPTSTSEGEKCVKRAWYGRCLEYGTSVDDKADLFTITEPPHWQPTPPAPVPAILSPRPAEPSSIV